MVAPEMTPETKTPNPEGKNTSKNPTDKIDYNKVVNDVQDFYKKNNEFIQQAEIIKNLGTENEKAEYEGIVKKIRDSYEPKVEELLKKMNINKVDMQIEQYESMTDDQIKELADKEMNQQPEKLNKQHELIEKINNNGSFEDIQGLIDIVNESRKETQDFWENFNEKRNTSSNSSEKSNYTVPGEVESGSVPETQPSTTGGKQFETGGGETGNQGGDFEL